MFFNWLRTRPQLSGRGIQKSFLRLALLMALFSATGWAFWINSERYIYKFNAGARLTDAVGAFSPEQKDAVTRSITRFDKNYSIKLYVSARQNLFTTADGVDNGILLGLCPDKKQVVIFMSPLLRNALGEALAAQMREIVLETDFDDKTWPQSVIKALALLEVHLQRMIPPR